MFELSGKQTDGQTSKQTVRHYHITFFPYLQWLSLVQHISLSYAIYTNVRRI